MTKKKQRPKITDPKEWDIIRQVYFESAKVRYDDLEPDERNDRLKRRRSKNQAR